jgi:hypothetical protein
MKQLEHKVRVSQRNCTDITSLLEVIHSKWTVSVFEISRLQLGNNNFVISIVDCTYVMK